MARSAMIVEIADFLIGFPAPVATMLFAAIPIAEMRGALPIALLVWGLEWHVAYVAAVIGNILPIAPLFFGLVKLRDLLNVWWPRLGKALDAWINRAHHKMHEKYERYGFWALFLFTAIPLPLTGVYTATAAAVALRIPFKQTFVSLCCGVIVSGGIVSLITLMGWRLTL